MKNPNLIYQHTFIGTLQAHIDFGITPLSMFTLIQYSTLKHKKITGLLYAGTHTFTIYSSHLMTPFSHPAFIIIYLYKSLSSFYVSIVLYSLFNSQCIPCCRDLLTCSAELRGTARRPVSTPISSPERSKLVLLVKVKIYTYVYGQGVCNFGGPSSGAPLYGKNTLRVRSLLSDYFTTDLEDRGLKPF